MKVATEGAWSVSWSLNVLGKNGEDCTIGHDSFCHVLVQSKVGISSILALSCWKLEFLKWERIPELSCLILKSLMLSVAILYMPWEQSRWLRVFHKFIITKLSKFEGIDTCEFGWPVVTLLYIVKSQTLELDHETKSKAVLSRSRCEIARVFTSVLPFWTFTIYTRTVLLGSVSCNQSFFHSV